ncbi:hypothetical protein F9U64_06130 [Gracilibacillus oryzae]|uniref:DUF4901 domain-containing protein n=1 Tax=Gracilibacillus oryzae TaxID=1672701 RepID=A0A7C8GUC8_9BACI|nr:hypothetical protein [Gracilibacillus oryzae]KAB8138204.1 hypothetical protein F9U64_06130 [Gracilibacillus oryzae]
MTNLVKKLKPFINRDFSIEILEDEFFLHIIDRETEEMYGTVLIDENGQLESIDIEGYSDEEIELESLETPVHTEEMMRLSQLFVDTFVQKEVHFSMLNEFTENSFMITYEERDPKLDVLIPHTGCTLHFTREGKLTSASVGQTDFTLEYPEIEISKEEAKERLRSTGYLQIAIDLPDQEEEGYGKAELIYRANDEYIGVNVDGTVDSLYEFMETEELGVKKIPAANPSETMEQMLQVNDHLVKKTGEDHSLIWVDPTMPVDE